MSRSARGAAAALVVALLLAGPAFAQAPATVPVLDVTFPILDVEFPVTSLGGDVSESGKRVVLQADVLFAFDSARLSKRARSRVAEAVTAIRAKKPQKLTVVGYTDSKGSPSFNLGLSRRRAQAVERALGSALGIRGPQLSTKGRGEADPVASNTKDDGADDPRGRARNRRVELVYG